MLLAALVVLVLPDQKQLRQPFEHDVPVPLDYAAAADVIRQHHRPGDAVVYDRENTWKLDSGVQYYLPRALRMRDVFLAEDPVGIDDLYPLQCAVPDLCLDRERRLWLVTQGPDLPFDAIDRQQVNALRSRYDMSSSESVTGMTVSLLVRRGNVDGPSSLRAGRELGPGVTGGRSSRRGTAVGGAGDGLERHLAPG